MYHGNLAWLLALRVFSAILLALPTLAVPVRAQSLTLNLKVLGEHVAVEGTVNGQPLRLILDTGAGTNVLTPDAAKRLGLTLTNADFQVKGAGDELMTVKQARLPEIRFGGAKLRNLRAVVVPLPAAMDCDGLLGAELFNAFVVTLDYGARKVTFSPLGTRPSGTPVPLRLSEANVPEIEASVDGIRGWFRLDTGAGDSLMLYSPFVERNNLREKYPNRLETVVGRGVGGLLRGDIARMESFTLGGYTIEKLPVDLSRQTGGAFFDASAAGNVGSSILKRFVVSFDYQGGRLFLTRGPLFRAPFELNRSGLSLDFEGGKVSVVAVIAQSPAAEVGMKEGDVVLALDGKPVTELKPGAVRAALRGKPGAALKLSVQSVGNAAPRELVLTLRDLL